MKHHAASLQKRIIISLQPPSFGDAANSGFRREEAISHFFAYYAHFEAVDSRRHTGARGTLSPPLPIRFRRQHVDLLRAELAPHRNGAAPRDATVELWWNEIHPRVDFERRNAATRHEVIDRELSFVCVIVPSMYTNGMQARPDRSRIRMLPPCAVALTVRPFISRSASVTHNVDRSRTRSPESISPYRCVHDVRYS